jgi:hypothetical protein
LMSSFSVAVLGWILTGLGSAHRKQRMLLLCFSQWWTLMLLHVMARLLFSHCRLCKALARISCRWILRISLKKLWWQPQWPVIMKKLLKCVASGLALQACFCFSLSAYHVW